MILGLTGAGRGHGDLTRRTLLRLAAGTGVASALGRVPPLRDHSRVGPGQEGGREGRCRKPAFHEAWRSSNGSGARRPMVLGRWVHERFGERLRAAAVPRNGNRANLRARCGIGPEERLSGASTIDSRSAPKGPPASRKQAERPTINPGPHTKSALAPENSGDRDACGDARSGSLGEASRPRTPTPAPALAPGPWAHLSAVAGRLRPWDQT